MQKSEIQVGKEYALREKRARRAPLQRVRIVEHVRGTKWKAEWIDPNPGLRDYVDSSWLITRWADQKAFLREEANAERLREHNVSQGHKESSPVALALGHIYESVKDDLTFYRGSLNGSPEAVGRMRARAGLEEGNPSPVGYVDRQGRVHLPYDEALDLARKFCAAEPATVLVGAESTEREWSQEAQRPGHEYLVDLLNEYRGAFALVRQWAGHDAAVAAREAQIQKLERLVWDAVYALQKAGLDREAAKLRRVLEP
jgi:hypothetical protein